MGPARTVSTLLSSVTGPPDDRAFGQMIEHSGTRTTEQH